MRLVLHVSRFIGRAMRGQWTLTRIVTWLPPAALLLTQSTVNTHLKRIFLLDSGPRIPPVGSLHPALSNRPLHNTHPVKTYYQQSWPSMQPTSHHCVNFNRPHISLIWSSAKNLSSRKDWNALNCITPGQFLHKCMQRAAQWLQALGSHSYIARDYWQSI